MSTRFITKRGASRLALAMVLAVAMVAVTAVSAFAAKVTVRVEGTQRTLFAGTKTISQSTVIDTHGDSHLASGTALWALDAASRAGAFPYELVFNTDYSMLFVNSVNGELPVPVDPYPGWSYRVNGVMANVGASDYVLKDGDDVLWYYGNWDAAPAAVAVPSTYVAVGTLSKVTAQKLDTNGVASPLADAKIFAGSFVATSATDGTARFNFSTPGDYGVRVEKDGFVRSALKILHVRYATRMSSLTASKSPVAKGTTVTLTGAMYGSGKMPSGRAVSLIARKAGTSTWKTIAHTTTGSTGKFRFSVKPYATTYYRASFAGDSTFGAANGVPQSVTVR